MNLNTNLVKGLGLVFVAGMGGGWLAQKIANRRYEKRIKDYDLEIKELRDSIMFEIDKAKDDAKKAMTNEAERSIQDALSNVAQEQFEKEILRRVQTVDVNLIANQACEKHMAQATTVIKEKLYKESKEILKDTIQEMAEEKVEDRIKDELYQVNSRRIIEDSVDRAIRNEVTDIMRDKLKWLKTAEDFRRIVL